MSSGFLSRVRSSGTSLVCDIGTGSVGAAILELTAGKHAATVRVGRRDMLSHEDRDSAQLVQSLTTQFAATLETVLKEHAALKGGAIRDVTVIFHAPWIETRTATGALRFQKPIRVTKDTIDQLTHKALEATPQQQAGEPHERTIVRLELNGYPTTSPIGKTASSAQAVVVESAAHPQLSQSIRQEVQRMLPDRPVAIRSYTLVALSAVREAIGGLEEFVIFDVGSEESAFSIVREGMLAGTGTLAFGSRQLVRSVADIVKSTPDEVFSLLRMMLDGTCAPRTCDAVNKALGSIERDLVGVFGKAFTGEGTALRLPNRLFASVPPELADWLGGFLERVDFGQFTVTGRPFTVTHLEAGHFGVRVQMPDTLHADASLAAAVAFVVSRN
jgi:hypothetical protein